MTTVLWATVLGGLLGGGIIIALSGLPVANRLRFAERVAPSMRSAAVAGLFEEPGRSTVPWGAAGRLFAPVLRELISRLDRFNTDAERLGRRLDQAGSALTATEYRLQQLGFAGAGVAAGTAVNLLGALAGTFNAAFAVLSILVLAVLGFALRDNLLSARVRRRQARMLAEFPTAAEMIALAVSAGESAPGAFERVARVSRGELREELDRVLREARAGTGFAQACRGMAGRLQTAPISRFLEGIIVAMERGTPLAEVMRAQAQDVRGRSKRELMETAGKKEISMLAPLVFGILPLVVLFAIYPGLSLLSIGV